MGEVEGLFVQALSIMEPDNIGKEIPTQSGFESLKS